MAVPNGAEITLIETKEGSNTFYFSGRVGPFGALNTALNGQKTAAELTGAANPIDWYSGTFDTAFDISKVFGCENPGNGGGLLIVRGGKIIDPSRAAGGDIVYLLPDTCQLPKEQADVLSNIISNSGELSQERQREDGVFLDEVSRVK